MLHVAVGDKGSFYNLIDNDWWIISGLYWTRKEKKKGDVRTIDVLPYKFQRSINSSIYDSPDDLFYTDSEFSLAFAGDTDSYFSGLNLEHSD